MGCCGEASPEEVAAPHLDPLLPLDSSRERSPVSSAVNAVISPMNSNFSALLCKDTLRTILENLPLPDLSRAACVCRLWRSVASDRGLQVCAFKSPWKLRDVIGNPNSSSFWRDNSLCKFAVSHNLSRSDSIASLAVKYSVQVMDIKRLNNMMSDHGIYSRERLLIPVSKPEILINSICYIELDIYAKREVAVLYLDGGPDRNRNFMFNRLTTGRGKKKVIDSLKKIMHVDDGTAQYYLSITNGDPRAALTQFSEDVTWERQDMLLAGVDTSSVSVEWALSEIIRHPDVMKKLQKELKEVVGLDQMVQESHLPKLEYFSWVVKEALRLHPVAPLMLHQSMQDCEVAGFFIPKNSRVVINLWSIGKDPNSWPRLKSSHPRGLVGAKSMSEVIIFNSYRLVLDGEDVPGCS